MTKERKLPIGGIGIKSISRICISVCLFILILAFFEINQIDLNCQELISNIGDCIEGRKCATSLENSSDYLTEEARLFVVRKNPEDMKHYFDEVQSGNRETMATRLEELYAETDPEAVGQLNEALQESLGLEQMEIHAMRLVSYALGMSQEELPEAVSQWKLTAQEEQMPEEELYETARELVYGDAYLQAKDRIRSDIGNTLSRITDGMEKEQIENGLALKRAFAQQMFLMILMLFLIGLVFWMIGKLILKPIREHIRSTQEDEKWELKGVREIQYLAHVYNQIYEKNIASQKELKHQANHDALTGIYNRAAFEKKKDELIGREVDVALILADINNFKTVNDTRGHKAGDEAIKRVARTFGRIELENKHCFARIGGDEFAMLLSGVKRDIFPKIAEQIEEMNEILKEEEGEAPGVSVSAGVAFSEEGYTDSLFRKADQALYHVKKYGRQSGTMCANWHEI